MIGLLILCVVFLALFILKRGNEKCLSPPLLNGCLPIIGHALMLHGNSAHLWKMLQRVSLESLKVGGVLEFKVGFQSYYVITDPDDALTIANNYVNKHYVYKFSKRWLGNGLITASGSTWKGHRKLLSPAFSLTVLLGFMDIFNAQSRKLRIKLNTLAGRGSFDVSSCFRQMALENICLTAFGISAEEDASLLQSYSRAVEIILNIVTLRFQTIWLHSDFVYSLTMLKTKEDDALTVINSMADVVRFSSMIIKKKRAAMLHKNNLLDKTYSEFRCKALLDLLLELSEEEALSDREIREEIDTAIAAALDSTAWVLTYTLILLGSHHEVQEKVYKELEEVFDKEDRDVNKYDLVKLVYLECVIKESLRLYTTGPITLRTLDKDVKLKNYSLKSGTHCILSAYGIHRHSCWGPDREVFKPERWLEPETQRFVFAGFSLGRRTCIGKTYAMMSMKIALSHLLRHYKVMANVNDLELKMDFILKPTSGHFVSIERRI